MERFHTLKPAYICYVFGTPELHGRLPRTGPETHLLYNVGHRTGLFWLFACRYFPGFRHLFDDRNSIPKFGKKNFQLHNN